MLVAVTGTPGVGKSSICAVLARKENTEVINVEELARKFDCITGHDMARDTMEVDMDKLDARLKYERFGRDADRTILLDGHLSHLLTVDSVVLLRCSPDILLKRLGNKEWMPEKIQENLEAEILDIIKAEAIKNCRQVHEIDATQKNPEELSHIILEALDGRYTPWEAKWLDDFYHMLPL